MLNTFIGRIGSTPELSVHGDNKVVNFSFASNRRVRRNGEWTTDTVWFRASAWGPLAESLAQLDKGASLIVMGHLEENSWEKDGETRKSINLVISEAGLNVRWAGKPAEAPSGEASPLSEDTPF